MREQEQMSGNLPSRLFCAPMAEITTPALRRVIREFSGNVVLYSEMLSAGAIAARARNNEPLIRKLPSDDPFVYQIVGSNPAVMADACRALEERGCYSIDINMGCSAPDILKTGAGARLLSDMKLAGEIVRRCRDSVSCKISVKLRSGFDTSDEAYLIDFVRMLECEGADFIALHPRHGKLGFRRRADWKLVKKIKESVNIPVIGNGDITGPGDALEKMRDSGCDGIMIGREAVKSPWIFRQCADIMRGISDDITIDTGDIFIRVLDYMEAYLPEKLHKSRGHRFCLYYSKNVRFSHDLFTRIRKESSLDGMKKSIEDYYRRNPDERKRKLHYKGDSNEADTFQESPGLARTLRAGGK